MGITDLELACRRDKQWKKFTGDLFIHEQALHGGTRLTCPSEGRIRGSGRRPFEIGIVTNDYCRDAAQFQSDGPQPDGLLQLLADLGASGKRIKRDVLVRHQPAPDFGSRALHQIHMARRDTGVEKYLNQQCRAERRRLRWLDHHGISRCQRRRNFVDDHVQR